MKPAELTKPVRQSLALGLGLWAVVLAQPARSHGAHLDYQVVPAVEVQAQFDSGEPMAQAQVAVFAPDEPETPWQTGLTDGAGAFRFSPDVSRAGAWEVQVRQAGHGSVITIPVAAQGLNGQGLNAQDLEADGLNAPLRAQGTASVLAPSAGSATLAPAQKALMIGLGLWGLLGTGLFFSRISRSPSVSPAQTPAAEADASREPPVPV